MRAGVSLASLLAEVARERAVELICRAVRGLARARMLRRLGELGPSRSVKSNERFR